MVNQAVVVLRHDTDWDSMCIYCNHDIPTGVPIFVKFGPDVVEDGWFVYDNWCIRFSSCEQIMFVQ